MKRKDASLKIRDFNLEIKAVSDDGLFSGYGSVFGVVDSYGEIVEPGAFTETLAAIAAKGRAVPVLWQHRSGQPIGVYTSMKEDERGLWVEGKLLKDDVQQAKEAYALLRAGAVSGLSIGYYVRDDSFDQKDGVRRLKKLDLVEVSLVTFPANEESRVDAVKFALSKGTLPDLPGFERLLREAGFSKSQATAIASHGFKHLLRSDSEGNSAISLQPLSEQLRSFSLPDFT